VTRETGLVSTSCFCLELMFEMLVEAQIVDCKKKVEVAREV
jgi:hypothetical protein